MQYVKWAALAVFAVLGMLFSPQVGALVIGATLVLAIREIFKAINHKVNVMEYNALHAGEEPEVTQEPAKE